MEHTLQHMDKEQTRRFAEELWSRVPGNMLCEEMGIKPEHVGTLMYDVPIVGFGAADDPLFEVYKKPGVIGPWHMSPEEWLPEAKTVISFFFPASEAVRESNRKSERTASDLWAYARIEGQEFIRSYMEAVELWFREQGIAACVPSADPRWQQMKAGKGIEGYPEIREDSFGSRWSERHAAYVCGLGTFGLSKGLITRRGMAGRFGSVVVGAAFDADPRPYTGIYDYCSRCGACIRRCAGHAIDLEHGKDHMKCMTYVRAASVVHAPRYGCGLCQTGVPCEGRIPVSLQKMSRTADGCGSAESR